jgi:hypothetical protein
VQDAIDLVLGGVGRQDANSAVTQKAGPDSAA